MSPYRLRDGTEVVVRPIRADDGERLQESHARLSPESKYQRFLSAKPELTAADARYLVDIDGCDHFALVATVADEAESIIAVTRFVRLPDDPDTAEFAIVVGDEYQRQGLATELVKRLAGAAAERGVKRFRATMLSDNVAIFKLLEQLAGGPLPDRRDRRDHRDGETREVDVDLVTERADVWAPGPAMIAAWAGS
jgi:RimJ/RimL family protein N-acetyltransferase